MVIFNMNKRSFAKMIVILKEISVMNGPCFWLPSELGRNTHC